MKSKRYSSSVRSLLFTIGPLLLLLPLTDSEISAAVKTAPAAAAATPSTSTNAPVTPSAAPPFFPDENCISYEPSNRIITIRCKSVTLADIAL